MTYRKLIIEANVETPDFLDSRFMRFDWMKAFSDTSPAAHVNDMGMKSAAMRRASFSVFPDTGRNGIAQASKRKRPSRRTKGIGL